MGTISFEYPKEKVIAIKIYLDKKELSLDEELIKFMDVLYEKQIPANVREFIELKENVEICEGKTVKRAYKKKIKREAEVADKSGTVGGL